MLVSSHKFLHDKLQEIYERSQVASNLKNYLPVMAEFAKELLSSPFFEDFQKGVLEALRNDLTPMLRFKEPCYKEVMVARELLVSYEQRIPVISIYLQKFNEIEKSRSPMRWELIEDLATVIKTACVCLTLKNQWVNTDDKQEELLVKLAKIDENGQIIDYIFMPSQRLFREELAIFERKKKNAVWYSIHVLSQVLDLFDLKSFEKKHHSLLAAKRQYAAFFLEEDSYQFNDALETKDISNTRFDVEECKVHMHRIWKAIEPNLLLKSTTANKSQKVAPSYNRTTGVLFVDGINITFKSTSLRANILTLLFRTGSPLSDSLPFDVIYEKAMEGESDPTWEELTPDERQKIKDKIYESADGINERVRDEANREIFIRVESLMLTVIP